MREWNYAWELNDIIWWRIQGKYAGNGGWQLKDDVYFVPWPKNNRNVHLVNDQLTHNSFLCIYLNSLHVSSNLVFIIRRINCINTTSGICHSVCRGLQPAHETVTDTEWHIPEAVLIQNWTTGNNYTRDWTEPAHMVWPSSKNGRRKTAQNSIEVDAETKRTRGRPKKNWMEGIKKAMNERILNEGQWEDRKQLSLGVGQRRKTFWIRYIHTNMYWYSWFPWWWARGCSKHVDNWDKYIEKNCASSWSFTKNHNKIHSQQNIKEIYTFVCHWV